MEETGTEVDSAVGAGVATGDGVGVGDRDGEGEEVGIGVGVGVGKGVGAGNETLLETTKAKESEAISKTMRTGAKPF